jgi:hypothetical protein
METPVQMMMAVASCFALALSLVGALVWRMRRPYAGSGRKCAANLFFALGLLLFTLRPAMPDWIGVVAANVVLAAAAILSLEATREYGGLRPQFSPAYAGGALAILTVVYFDYVEKNINARIFAMSAFMGVVAVLCSVTLLRERPAKRTLGVAISGGTFAISAVLLIARAICFLFAPPLTDLFAPSGVNIAFLVACGLSIACCSIGWEEVTGEWVLMDLKEAERRVIRANRETAEAREREISAVPRAAAAAAATSGFLETMHQEAPESGPASYGGTPPVPQPGPWRPS